MKKLFLSSFILIILSLSFSACVPLKSVATTEAPTAAPAQPPVVSAEQPYQITGGFTYTNDFVIGTYFVEQAVALMDMYGFVKRDLEWEMPVASQTLGFLKIDQENKRGDYVLQLPVKPTGVLVDVDNNGTQDKGVQVFVVGYSPNLSGGPYSEGDDRSLGWPNYMTSTKIDTENDNEVTGGKLVVWSPDDKQQFPTGFGDDGLLFTADDPAGAIPAGYSVVDLDAKPFTITQEAEPKIELYEPKDVALKDYSGDSYTVAFDKMFERVKNEYAFNGIKGKQPDWDTLYAELKPRVEEAEKNHDPMAYYLALRDYTWAFNDGHVSLSGGDYQNQEFTVNYGGGFGFAQRELDDGRVIVIYIIEGGPADLAGIKVGAEIKKFNGTPIKDAISQVKPASQPFSTEFSRRYQQVRYLLRTPVGSQASFSFANPGETEKTVSLTSVNENVSNSYTSIYKGFDPNALPVEFKILGSGAGYVKINSNYDDLNLIVRLFERALKTFKANNVPGIIVDLRQNSGGSPLGLAGFLTDQTIQMGQLEYYSEKTGEFEPDGVRQKVTPNVEQYSFRRKVLMVGQACASACEIEAYGFSQVPGMIIVGQYPSAGIEAEVARGQYNLPEGFSLQVPTGRFTLPDGSIFLEGQGVQPTQRVAITEALVLSQDDEILKAAELAATQPLGAGLKPSGAPSFEGGEEALTAAQGDTKFMEDLAVERYSSTELLQMDRTFSYNIELTEQQPLIWAWGWCAKDQANLDENLGKTKLKFVLDGQNVPVEKFFAYKFKGNDGQACQYYLAQLSNWPGGEHHLNTTLTFTAPVDDGTNKFTAGTQVFDYTVYVKP